MTEPSGAARTAPTPLVPDWLSNLAALGWRVLAIATMAVVLWFVATSLWVVSASIAVSVVVAAVFSPFVLRLRAGGRSRMAAASIVWVVAVGSIGGLLLLLALALMPYVVELARWIEAGMAQVRTSLADLQVPPVVGEVIDEALKVVRAGAGDAVGGVVASAASVVTVLILSVFLVFFLLRDGDRAWVWMFQALGDQKRERITSAGDVALARVGGYLRGTTLLSALIAVTDLVFMWLLGVPLAVPLAILVFLSGYIPYFGGFVATLVILLVTVAAQGPGPALVLLVLIGIRNVFLGYLVRPAVYGRTVRIHPALVLVVLPAGFELAGVVGLFAAVPVTAIVLAVAAAVVEIVEPHPAPQLPALVPPWLDRMAQWSWRVLVTLALLALVAAIATELPLVVVPVAIAVILAATLEPLVRALIRRGRTRGRAAAITVGGGILVVIAVLVVTVVVLVDRAREMGDAAVSGANTVSANLGSQLDLGADAVAAGAGAAVRTVIALGQSAATVGVITILSALLAFYFLRDGPQLWDRFVARIRTDVAPELDAAGTRAIDVLGGYMFGTAAISFVGAASQLAIMILLGIPLALPVFVLSFILCFIPYIGGFISTGIAFLLTVAFGSPFDVAIMGIWTIAFNIVQGNVVSPVVYGKTVHLHPAIVLLAIPAASAVAGIAGMFVVVPVLGVVAATWRTVLSLIAARRDRAGAPAPPSASAEVATASG